MRAVIVTFEKGRAIVQVAGRGTVKVPRERGLAILEAERKRG